FALRNQIRCEYAGDRDQEVIVEVGLAGIEPRIGAVIHRAGEEILTLQRVATIDLSLLALVPVNAHDRLIAVLRVSGPLIGRQREASFSESRKIGRQSAESAEVPDSEYLAIDRSGQFVRSEECLGGGAGSRDQLRSRNHVDCRSAAANAGPFRAAEEVQLVFFDRAADGIAKLIARESAFLVALRVVFKAVGGQRRDPVEVEDRAVKRISAGLRRHVDDAAGSAPVLGRKVAGDDAKFMHRIERDSLTYGGREGIVVVGAVEQDIGARRPLSVKREVRATSHGRAAGVLGPVARYRNQVIWVAGQSRQVGTLFAGDDALKLLMLSVDLDAAAGDDVNHAGRDGRYRERHVNRDFCPHGHVDLRDLVAEPRGFDVYVIDARLKVRDNEETFRAAGH